MRVIIKHTDNISSKIRQLLDFSRLQAVAPSSVHFDVAVERASELVQWTGTTVTVHWPTVANREYTERTPLRNGHGGAV
jgi:hypothetical protein